jgi:uncharacterized SAM-binding protein YcdF (DUF218 family)
MSAPCRFRIFPAARMPPAFRSSRSSLCRRIVAAELLIVVALIVAAPFAGRLAHAEDPLQRADAIFVLAGERILRWMEASDLLREEWAPRVVLSAGYREQAERQLIAKGIQIPSEGDVARSALLQLGHPPDIVEILPGFPDNTAAEGVLLRQEGLARGWTRVIVVTSKLHTRRAGYAIRRELDGSGIGIVMRASRHDEDDPARWWARRRTARGLLSELPKLAAYLLGMRD